MNLNITEKSLRSFDGTRITYQTFGRGPVVALANGLGGSLLAWKHVINHFQDRFRFISWDYRGLFHSDAPDDPQALNIDDHCRDLMSVLEAEEVDSCIVMGWSMGVQVALEFWHIHPALVNGLVLVNGTYGELNKVAFNSPLSPFVLPLAYKAAKLGHSVIETFIKLTVDLPITMPVIKATNLVDRHLDESVFHDLAKGFRHIDMQIYADIMERLAAHTSEPYLHLIDAPTLVVHGENDILTPHWVTDKFMTLIQDCELFTVPNGTHYSIIEYPEIVNLRLEKYFDKVARLLELETSS